MKNTARFDARLSLEQKDLLERAAQLGGYRSLSDFILTVAEQKALEIIALEQQISLSQKDAELFCATLLEAQEPNAYLQMAAEESATYFQWKRK